MFIYIGAYISEGGESSPGLFFLWENLCNNACLKIDTATLDRDVCFRYMRGSRKLLPNPPTLSDPHMHEFFPCV